MLVLGKRMGEDFFFAFLLATKYNKYLGKEIKYPKQAKKKLRRLDLINQFPYYRAQVVWKIA
jgi:hypothetical protein